MKSLLSRSCKDDRGASVEVLSHASAGHWVVSGDARIEGMMYRAANPKVERGGWDWIGLLMIAGSAVAMVVLLRVMFPGAPGWTTMLVFMAAAGGTTWVLARLWTARNAGRLIGVVLEEGLCAVCGYNLHGCVVHADGCVQCPECGAAWKSARILRSEPLASGAVFGDPAHLVGKTATRLVTDSYDTVDARGMPVRIADMAKLREVVKRGRDESAKEWARALQRLILRKTARVRWVCVAGLCGIAGAAWLWGGPPVLMVMPLGFTVGFILGQFGASMLTVRDTMLNAGACPACLEDLRAVEIGEDWVRTCPRCRAAWRIARERGETGGRS